MSSGSAAAAHAAAVVALEAGDARAALAACACADQLFAAEHAPDPIDGANLLLTRARAHRAAGELAEFRRNAELALSTADIGVSEDRHDEPGDANRIWHRLLIQGLLDLADADIGAGDYASAGPRVDRAVAAAEQHLGREDGDTASAWNSAGVLRRYLGDLETARTFYEQALVAYGRLGRRHDSADLLHNLASLDQLTGDHCSAVGRIREAIAARPTGSAKWAADLAVLAAVLCGTDVSEDVVERAFADARTALLAVHGPESVELVYLDANHVAYVHQQGRLREAAPMYRTLIANTDRALGAEHPQTGVVLANAARCALEAGESALAREYATRADAVLSDRVHDDLPSLRQTRRVLQQLDDMQ